MSYEYFYHGNSDNLNPYSSSKNSLFTGYTSNLTSLALTTDGRTANQLQEVSNKLNTGINTLELSGSDPALLDSIPKQQFKEIGRLLKLTNAEVSLHGPQIEASGFGREGWSEAQRQSSERQMSAAVERAHDLNEKGNIPVTFHSSAQLPEGTEYVKEGGKSVPKGVHIVEIESGRYLGQLKPKERYFPGETSAKEFNVRDELKRQSEESWREMQRSLAFDALRSREASDVLSSIMENPTARETIQLIKENKVKPEDLPQEELDLYNKMRKHTDLNEAFSRVGYRELKDMFNKAYISALDMKKSPDREISEKAQADLEKLNNFKNKIADKVKDIEKDPRILPEIIDEGVSTFNSINTPILVKPLDEFVFDKSATTFSNVAFSAWKQFGNSAPLVSIENPPAGGGISRAEDLKKLIEESRKKFVEQAKKEGMSESAAKSAAEKMIGATWDVGHINMLRKFGYDTSDIVKESKTIAPFVKHVHLSDNFGMEHTELPMGMGNVPIKEIMENLGKEGFKGKKVIEAFQWWQHMKTPPLVPTLEAFGSPLYPMLAQPNWAQAAGTYGNYFAFPSAYLPEQHFSLYGGGFSSLPQELGGQMPGKQSRLTGTPMD